MKINRVLGWQLRLAIISMSELAHENIKEDKYIDLESIRFGI